jgi:hypothetical protein
MPANLALQVVRSSWRRSLKHRLLPALHKVFRLFTRIGYRTHKNKVGDQLRGVMCRYRRESLVRDRVKTRNPMHGFLLEFGINLAVGQAVIAHL